MSTLALSYLKQIDSNVLEKAEFPSHLIKHNFEKDDLKRLQMFIIEEMKRILNIDLISKEVDKIARFEDIDNTLRSFLQESELVHKFSNHPVHIKDDDKFSPSSFIPFCQFGRDIDIMGVDVEHFDIPVCNSFKAKILNDQLCYEIDLNQYKINFTAESLDAGLTFLVDLNEDRQFKWHRKDHKNSNKKGFSTLLFLH